MHNQSHMGKLSAQTETDQGITTNVAQTLVGSLSGDYERADVLRGVTARSIISGSQWLQARLPVANLSADTLARHAKLTMCPWSIGLCAPKPSKALEGGTMMLKPTSALRQAGEDGCFGNEA